MKSLREQVVEGRLEELHMYVFDQRNGPEASDRYPLHMEGGKQVGWDRMDIWEQLQET